MKLKEGLEESYAKAIELSADGKYEMNSYAQGIIDYANRWAELMEVCIVKGETLESCAERTSHESDTDGITGNMYGHAAMLISAYWVHGDKLKVWHNSKYGRPDAKGVINPAILVMSPKE